MLLQKLMHYIVWTIYILLFVKYMYIVIRLGCYVFIYTSVVISQGPFETYLHSVGSAK